MDYQVISADDHVVEPADVFTRRVPARWHDQIPHIEQIDGKDLWVVEGKVVGRIFSKAGVPFSEWSELRDEARYDTIRPGGYDPVERLKDYDIDGVDAGVLFPNPVVGFAGDPLYSVKDPQVRLACIQAYNDWLVEDFCGVNPERLIALCVLPSWDVELAVAEAQRSVKKGHRGIVFAGAMDVFGQQPTWDPYWDPLWAAVQDLDVVLCFHQISAAMDRPTAKELPPPELSGIIAARVVWHICTLVPVLPEILFSGMLDRFPRLKVFLAEGGVGWIPFVLSQSDFVWERNRHWAEPKLKMPPSEYWRRQCAAGFWSEPISPFLVEYLGADTILWEGDYPHTILTWPDSLHHIDKSLAQIPDVTARRKITAENAIRLFNL